MLLAVDLARPPEEQLSARAVLGARGAYQATLSPLFGAAGVECRFRPTCSRYAVGAVREDGALIGSLRAVGRVMRCGPWTPAGTVDPP
ncbi:MAG TPA: membrane protein insertion efficiency factor YidD [Thermoanaerobaculia bacterium]